MIDPHVFRSRPAGGADDVRVGDRVDGVIVVAAMAQFEFLNFAESFESIQQGFVYGRQYEVVGLALRTSA